jgi:hypothetical protein
MDDREAHEYYADPAHLAIAGPARKHPKDQLTRVLSARISPSLINQVTAAAGAEGRSVGSWVRRALRDALEHSGWRADERRRREAALATTAEVTGGRAVPPHVIPRPDGLISGSGRAGEPRAFPSGIRRGYGYAMTLTASGHGRTFACPHFSVGNAVSASCEQCGPLPAAA